MCGEKRLYNFKLKKNGCTSLFYLVGLPLRRGDVEVGRLKYQRVLDVPDEGVGQVGQALAQVPAMRFTDKSKESNEKLRDPTRDHATYPSAFLTYLYITPHDMRA